jgi:hypothetical protein
MYSIAEINTCRSSSQRLKTIGYYPAIPAQNDEAISADVPVNNG